MTEENRSPYKPIQPIDIANLDQATTDLINHFVPMFKNLFDAFVREGFNEQQALTLTIAWMHKPAEKDM